MYMEKLNSAALENAETTRYDTYHLACRRNRYTLSKVSLATTQLKEMFSAM